VLTHRELTELHGLHAGSCSLKQKKQTHSKVPFATFVLHVTWKTPSRESFNCSPLKFIPWKYKLESWNWTVTELLERYAVYLISVVFHYSICGRVVLNFHLFIWRTKHWETSSKIKFCNHREFNNSSFLCRMCWSFSECFDCNMIDRLHGMNYVKYNFAHRNLTFTLFLLYAAVCSESNFDCGVKYVAFRAKRPTVKTLSFS